MMNESGYAVAAWKGVLQLAPQFGDITYQIIISATRSSDGVWSPVQIIGTLDEDKFLTCGPKVAVNDLGLAVVMWEEKRDDSSTSFIMSSFLPFGGTWTTAVELDAPGISTDAIYTRGSIQINNSGNVVAVWQLEIQGVSNDIVKASTYDPLTGTWTKVTLATAIYSGFEDEPEVAIDDNGNAVAIWNNYIYTSDGYLGQIITSYFTYGSGWGTPEIIYNVLGSDAVGPYVVMDHLGTATAVWGGGVVDAGAYSSRLERGQTWSAPELIGLGLFSPYANQEAVSVDEQGNVIVIVNDRYNGRNTYLRSILRTVQGGWQPPEDIFSDRRSNIDNPNIGLGSCGFALAFWQETNYMQGADNFGLANYILLAPSNFLGTRCCAKFATQSVCISSFSWDPAECASIYYIRSNGVVIATIPAGGSLTFITTACTNATNSYTLSYVNDFGIESPGVSVTLP
ncbi:MAG TPA: hypothetical protein VGP47_09995 [Parachlamydiaceae bacterium]|nr:hypothetical protein [Parachlamydiaceae bacterium]